MKKLINDETGSPDRGSFDSNETPSINSSLTEIDELDEQTAANVQEHSMNSSTGDSIIDENLSRQTMVKYLVNRVVKNVNLQVATRYRYISDYL